MDLSMLRPAKGSRHREKRVGRGPGSGHGKTSCRGHKGQGARSNRGSKPGFEGGQMPLLRRLPKRGFSNKPFKIEYAVVNLKDLERFTDTEVFDPEFFYTSGLVKKKHLPIKVLGDGDVTRPLIVKAHRFSKSAIEKITAAGGKAEVLS